MDNAERKKWMDRIGKMLRKAESAATPEEAEVFQTKAQSLMAQYSITEAEATASGNDTGNVPMQSKFHVYEPWATQKIMLMNAIARTNRCRIITVNSQSTDEYKVAHIFGMTSDVEYAVTLYASLLIQMAQAHAVAERPYDYRRGKPMHGRKFTPAFYGGYAAKIEQRLQDANKTHEIAAPITRSTELVFIGRKEEIDRMVSEFYPKLKAGRSLRMDDRARNAGVAAAARASLNRGSIHAGSTRQLGRG